MDSQRSPAVHTTVLPDGWRKAAGYSYGVVATGGERVFVAGQLGQDMETGTLAGSFAGQWEQALANVVEVVRSAGGSPAEITAIRVYVTDLRAYEAARGDVGPAYGRQMGDHFPAMTMLEVSRLVEPGALVEIEAEAVITA